MLYKKIYIYLKNIKDWVIKIANINLFIFFSNMKESTPISTLEINAKIFILVVPQDVPPKPNRVDLVSGLAFLLDQHKDRPII